MTNSSNDDKKRVKNRIDSLNISIGLNKDETELINAIYYATEFHSKYITQYPSHFLKDLERLYGAKQNYHPITQGKKIDNTLERLYVPQLFCVQYLTTENNLLKAKKMYSDIDIKKQEKFSNNTNTPKASIISRGLVADRLNFFESLGKVLS